MKLSAQRFVASVASIALAFSPSLACAREAGLITNGRAMNAPLPALFVPSLGNAMLPRLDLPKAGIGAQAAQAAPAAAAQASMASALPALLDPAAPVAALKTQAAAAFDASAPKADATVQPVAAALPSAAAVSGLTARADRRAALRAIPAPRASRWAENARKYLPAAAAVTVAAGLGLLAHMTGQAEVGLAGFAASLPFFAGSLNGKSPPNENAFRYALGRAAAPGQALTVQVVADLAKRLDLNQTVAAKIIAEETAAGRLALFSNGLIIRVDLGADKEATASQRVIKIASTALAQRDLPLPQALAALGRLAAARDSIIRANPENLPSVERQLDVLRANFGFDVLRRMLAGAEAQTHQYVMGLSTDILTKPDLPSDEVAMDLSILLGALPAAADTDGMAGAAYLKSLVQSLLPEGGSIQNLTSARSALDDVRSALRHYMVPGFEVTAAIKASVAKDLSMDLPALEVALRTLAANNWLVRVGGSGQLLYTSVAEHLRLAPRDENAPERKAVLAAIAGVRHLNGASPLEHALAERSFAEAATLLQQGDLGNPWGDFAAEVHLLRRNAMIKIVTDVLAMYELGRDAGLDDHEWRMLNGWKRWLSNGYSSNDSGQPKLEQGLRGWMIDVMDWATDSRRNFEPLLAAAHGQALAAALKATSEYVPTLNSVDDAKLLRLSAPQNSASAFPLIAKDDKKYATLNKYASNITAAAAAGKIDPVIGRDEELQLMYEVLLGRKKNNPIIYGEAGVGKTAIVEKLAQQLVKGEVPERLKNKNIFSLDLNALIAGTTLRGEFEARLQGVLDEVSNSNGAVILFIDEIHMVIGLGSSEGASDMANVLKRRMDRGGFSVIGATTSDEYKKIEKNKALDRRFGGVFVRPTTVAETTAIIETQRPLLEGLHKVKITDGAVAATPKLAKRFITDRRMPDSAIDLLDAAAAEAELRGAKELSADDVARTLARRKNLPIANLSEDQTQALRAMPQEFKKRVIGQDEAVDAVVEAEQMSRLDLKDPNQPDAFIFVGPTGVGKTEVARVLAKFKYGDEGAVLKIDGSDYMEKHNVSRLNGAPPGYIGHEEGGQLTEPIRRRPNQVVLFDEIDKMHPDGLNLLLQILEDGEIKDTEGRVIDFRNTTIVFTANFLGEHSTDRAGEIAPIGFGAAMAPAKKDEEAATQAQMKAKYLADLKQKLRPEFLNRVGDDRIMVFNELSKDSLGVIVDLRIADLNARFADRGQAISLTPRAKTHLIESTWATARRFGARPVKQAINRQVVKALSTALLDGRVAKTDAVVADYDEARGGWIIDKSAASAN